MRARGTAVSIGVGIAVRVAVAVDVAGHVEVHVEVDVAMEVAMVVALDVGGPDDTVGSGVGPGGASRGGDPVVSHVRPSRYSNAPMSGRASSRALPHQSSMRPGIVRA